MEFKQLEKWRVQKELKLSEKQINKAIKVMIRRHPFEKWINKLVFKFWKLRIFRVSI